MSQEITAPDSVQELVDLVKSQSSIVPRGGGSKTSLFQSDDSTTILDTRKISGIVEYQPSEYVITAAAGTTLSEVIEALKANGQYLPFDPPLASEGATLGGTLAAGLSGPGAYRYGPIKDFIIGVRFIDGLGNQVRGGGKVVKNAAGFDFPKLFNGSMGRLGILTELSFKVFPEPQAYVTLQTPIESFDEAARILPSLKGFDLEGVELSSELMLSLRLGYQEPTMNSRKKGLESLTGKPLEITLGEQEPQVWQQIKSFSWLNSENKLFKTATTPESAFNLLRDLDPLIWRTYLTNGGKTLYLGCEVSTDTDLLDSTLTEHNLTGLQLRGPVKSCPLIGKRSGLNFIERIQSALDPKGVFLPFSHSTQVPA
jgi:glycolate oxidase FAD binding subunit